MCCRDARHCVSNQRRKALRPYAWKITRAASNPEVALVAFGCFSCLVEIGIPPIHEKKGALAHDVQVRNFFPASLRMMRKGKVISKGGCA